MLWLEADTGRGGKEIIAGALSGGVRGDRTMERRKYGVDGMKRKPDRRAASGAGAGAAMASIIPVPFNTPVKTPAPNRMDAISKADLACASMRCLWSSILG